MTDIEAMKAELEAAGYGFDSTEDDTYNGRLWAVYTPKCEWECHYPSDIEYQMDNECKTHLVTKAYAHYQRETRYTEARAFIATLLNRIRGLEEETLALLDKLNDSK